MSNHFWPKGSNEGKNIKNLRPHYFPLQNKYCFMKSPCGEVIAQLCRVEESKEPGAALQLLDINIWSSAIQTKPSEFLS